MFVSARCALNAYSIKWLDSIGYDVIRHSSQCQRAPDSDYKSIFPHAEADVYIMTDAASVVVDKGGTDKSIKRE